jgi:ribonuclease Z
MSPILDFEPSSIAARVAGYRRVLLFGSPGSGKSTLAAKLAVELAKDRVICACVSADPGSPSFGVPGAVCLGRWSPDGWICKNWEPLCSLDAARFRLPLIQALHRLMKHVLPPQFVFVDAPGVIRGAAAAELLDGFVESAEIDAILVLERPPEGPVLEKELRVLGLPVIKVRSAAEARRPPKSARDHRRTTLWDKFLDQASEYRIDLDGVVVFGTPPPRDVRSAWTGRQVALIKEGQCMAFGEALELSGHVLRAKLCGDPRPAQALLIRDAARNANGLLTTTKFFREDVEIPPPPDMGGYSGPAPEPRPVVRVGAATAMLVNGVFGDPLLHVRLQHQKRSLLFDLGESSRLPARIAHQVTDVFISHGHIDHIGGFVWLLRSRIGNLPACRIFGPPMVADNIAGFLRGVHWDRVGERAPRFEVTELHEQRIYRYRIQAGDSSPELTGENTETEGILVREPAFQVRATVLDHRTPVLAFALELQSGAKLAYATDLADTVNNRMRLQALADGAHTLFCEAPFCEADVERSARTGHLTARACGEIATAARVHNLIPFHFSRRYLDQVERVYAEVKAACDRTVIPRRMRGSL